MKLNSTAVKKNVAEVVGRVRINREMSTKQVQAGILATANINHPAFITKALIGRTSEGKLFVSSESTQTADGNWFNIVSLSPAMRSKILKAYEDGIEQDTWYLEMLGERPAITTDNANEALDIRAIYINEDINDKQKEAGVVCKATVATSAGNIRGITIFRSKFGKELYLVEQSSGDRKAYELTSEAKAQVLNHIHSLVEDWGEEEVEEVVEEVTVDDMPVFNEELYK
jgi:hypothetical protein